jgi:hypothetical protein
MDPPVAAPDGLLAEAWVRSPDATWAKLQHGVSGAVALLPPSVGELACAFAGLDVRVARLVDGKGISYAVLAQGPGSGDLAWVLALPLADSATASAMLLEGSDAQGARYSARDVGGMRVLAGRERPLGAAAAIAHGWLLVASSDDGLTRLGPYAYRTMPTRAAPPGSSSIVVNVPQAALGGAIAARLSAKWDEMRAYLAARDEEQRARHGGRAPDFGDPRAILTDLDAAVKDRIGLVARARAARVEIDAGDDDVHADAFVTPGEGDAGADAVAAMRTGDTSPLARSPADAIVAVLSRDDAASRGGAAHELEASLDRALGGHVHDDDSRALRAALDDWARTRGDWWTVALAWGATDATRGLWVRTPAKDADASSRAVRELVDLSHRRAVQDMLSGSLHLAPATVTSSEAPSLGKATVATFPWSDAKVAHREGASSPPLPPAIAWSVEGGDLLLAAGQAAPQLLTLEAAPAHRIGDDERSARALEAIGSDATFAIYAQPLRFDPARSGGDAASSPAVLAWGRKGAEAWARLDLADTLLRELVRLQAGL